MGTYPDRSVLLASYEADFAASWGMKARDVLTEVGEQVFGVRIHPEVASRNNWKVQRFDGRVWQNTDGMMATAGIGGALTGRGASLCVVDDPIKNYEEATSRSRRDKVWDWWRSVMVTRLEPNGSIVLVLTRWHQDDIAGRLLGGMDDGETWELIDLPALSKGEGDALGRAEGAALWPGRFDASKLASIRDTLGPMIWSALYQQEPAAEGGTVFFRRHLRYWRRHGDTAALMDPDGGPVRLYGMSSLPRICYVDPALTEKQTADPTMILTVVVTPDGDQLALEAISDRVQAPDVKQLIRTTAARHGASRICVEPTAYQASIIQELSREGLPVTEAKVEGNKHTRAITASSRMTQGKFWLLADASWLGAFEKELLDFPNAPHDEAADVTAFALADTVGRAGIRPVVVVRREDPHDNVLTAAF